MTMMIMMIIAMVKMKGGVSERVGSSWGEVMSAPWFQSLETKWRTQRMKGSHPPSSLSSLFTDVFMRVHLYGSYQTLGGRLQVFKMSSQDGDTRLFCLSPGGQPHSSAIKQCVDQQQACLHNRLLSTMSSNLEPVGLMCICSQYWQKCKITKTFSEFLSQFTGAMNGCDVIYIMAWSATVRYCRSRLDVISFLSAGKHHRVNWSGSSLVCLAHPTQLDISINKVVIKQQH